MRRAFLFALLAAGAIAGYSSAFCEARSHGWSWGQGCPHAAEPTP